MAKLLYITSVGHSGSTLLDLVFGSVPNVVSLGEMQFLSWQLLQGEVKDNPQTYCSCGSHFTRCNFWKPIFDDVGKQTGVNLFDNPRDFDTSLNRSINRNKVDETKRFFDRLITLSTWSAGLSPLFFVANRFFENSARRNWLLFDLISEISGCEIMVDSSKNLNRYLLLKKQRPNDVFLVPLIRDVKGVASSSHYGLNERIIQDSANDWLRYHNKKLKRVLDRTDTSEYEIVGYEELCADPSSVLTRVLNKLRQNSSKTVFQGYVSPHLSHTIQGNPIRLKKQNIKLRNDERWRSRLTHEQIIWLNQLKHRLDKEFLDKLI